MGGGYRDPSQAKRVYLRRELDVLMLELYGWPMMLKERIMNLDLGYLDVANPDG